MRTKDWINLTAIYKDEQMIHIAEVMGMSSPTLLASVSFLMIQPGLVRSYGCMEGMSMD